MRLYVETSVISFWYDQHRRNLEKRRAVIRTGPPEAFLPPGL